MVAKKYFIDSIAEVLKADVFDEEKIVEISREYDEIGRYNAKLILQLAMNSISPKLTEKTIKSNNRERDTGWARYLFVCYMKDLGIEFSTISRYLNKTEPAIRACYLKANELIAEKNALFLQVFQLFYNRINYNRHYLQNEKTLPSKISDESESQHNNIGSRVWWNRFVCSLAAS